MPLQKRSRKAPRKRALAIHHNARMRSKLVHSLIKSGWEAFGAEGRTDGMPLLFQIHPSLIFVEVISGQDAGWDLYSSIRLFSNAPIVILTDEPPHPIDKLLESDNAIIVSEYIPTIKIVSTAKSFWQQSHDTTLSEASSVLPESWTQFYQQADSQRNEASNEHQT